MSLIQRILAGPLSWNSANACDHIWIASCRSGSGWTRPPSCSDANLEGGQPTVRLKALTN